MSAGLSNTTIETFRIRTHGEKVLRLYALEPDGESLKLTKTVYKGFLITRNSDTQIGAPEHVMTVDTVFTAGLTTELIMKAYMVALYNPATGKEQRFAVTTDTQPEIDDWRFVCGLHPRYNDKKVVIP